MSEKISFLTIDRTFGIRHSAILANVRIDTTKMKMRPHHDKILAAKGEREPTGVTFVVRSTQIMTSGGMITLGPKHTEEFDLFLKDHPLDKPVTIGENRLKAQPKPKDVGAEA